MWMAWRLWKKFKSQNFSKVWFSSRQLGVHVQRVFVKTPKYEHYSFLVKLRQRSSHFSALALANGSSKTT